MEINTLKEKLTQLESQKEQIESDIQAILRVLELFPAESTINIPQLQKRVMALFGPDVSLSKDEIATMANLNGEAGTVIKSLLESKKLFWHKGNQRYQLPPVAAKPKKKEGKSNVSPVSNKSMQKILAFLTGDVAGNASTGDIALMSEVLYTECSRALTSLRNQGMVDCVADGLKKMYTINDKGIKYLKELQSA